MGRGGAQHKEDEGQRRCIVTRESQPRSGLIRFVISPEGQIVPDIQERLPGRGIWVSASAKALDEAVRKNLFAKAARQTLPRPDGLPQMVELLLVKRLQGLLSLARKGGYAICGYEKTRKAVQAEGIAALLQASDGSEAQKRKIRPPDGPDSYISCLTGDELGLAFGRENVIHAAIAMGGLADQILSESRRLAGLRQEEAPKAEIKTPATRGR